MNQSLPFSERNAAPADEAADVSAAPAAPDFESALAQLESLVARMEDGDLPLEQSLAAYQQGVALARECQSLLDKAEERVKVLQGETLVPYQDQQSDDDENGAD